MDQRNSLKIKGTIELEKIDFDKDNFDKKKFGNKIKLLSKSFNRDFIDQIDVENYKNFVNTIYGIVDICYKFKLARKIFKDYQIHLICLDNINMLGKDYFCYLYDKVIKRLFTSLPGGMQPHRDIIDMCKKAYEKTGYIECYYYLANIIYHMCICCCRPSNADQTAYKYYQICLDSGYETYSIYYDLIEICYNFIWNDDIDIKKKQIYFKQIIDYKNKLNDKKYHDEKFYISDMKSINYKLVQSSININDKDNLDLLLNQIDISDLKGIYENLLCYYKDYPNDFSKLLEKIKNFFEPIEFIDLMIDVNFELGNYQEMLENINHIINLEYNENSKIHLCINDKIIDYMLENSINIENNFFLKLVNFYYINKDMSKCKLFFILFFDKIIISDVEKEYLNDIITLFGIKNNDNTYFSMEFDKNYTIQAKKFIDGIGHLTDYLIDKKNKNIIKNFINFLSKINPYCDYDNQLKLGHNFTNPYGPKNLNDSNIQLFAEEQGKKYTWDKVKGDDPDYDLIYPTYSDYYKAIYHIKKNSPELEEQILMSNNYIQEKFNTVKDKFDNYLKNQNNN